MPVYTVDHYRIPELPGAGRLGRHYKRDSRSAAYPYQRKAAAIQSVEWPRHAPILDQGNVGSCFPMDTRIRMADGSERPIQDVRLLDRVVTAEGNTGRVTRTMVRDEDGGLVRLVMWGHSHLRLTREHPVLTKRGYVPAAELRVGDQVAFPRYLPGEHRAHVITADHITKPSHRVVRGTRWQGLPGRRGLAAGSHAIPEKIELTPQFGRLIGLFLAEGNVDNARVIWSLHLKEKDTLGDEIASILAGYGADASRRDLPEHNGHKVTAHGNGWARLLSSLCGNGSGLKRLHPDLTSGPAEFLEAVLSGWRDGDGYRRKTSAEHTGITISHDLALAMYDIAQALGYRPAIRHVAPTVNGYARTRQWRWEVATSGVDARNYSIQDERHVWRKIRELRLEDFVGPVYNLSVEGDQSYVAEGVGVHNCTGNAMTGALATDPLYPALAAGHPGLDETLALRIYSEAEMIDGGAGYPPEDAGSTGQSVCHAARNDGLISGYTWCQDVPDMLDALMAGPVLLGVNWYTSFDVPAPDGTVSLPDRASIRGGHEIVARKYDAIANLIWCDNSWGTAWGQAGSFAFPAAVLERLFAEDGDCAVPLPLTAPAPVPVPVPDPAVHVDAADLAYAAAVPAGWEDRHHVGDNGHAATAYAAWKHAKGMS